MLDTLGVLAKLGPMLGALQVYSCAMITMVCLALLTTPGDAVAADVPPAQWLQTQTAPQFQAAHTLPPLTRWGWSMDMAKCLYTEGMIGGCAGYFSFPKGGFSAKFAEDKPPHWLVQMVVLARVHALFSHLESFLREASLLPGPAKHKYATDQPAYEFPTGDSNLRVLARKMPNKSNWLLTAWSSNGVEQDATVQIPELGAVTVHGRAVGSVYTASIEGGKPIVIQVDARNAFGEPIVQPGQEHRP